MKADNQFDLRQQIYHTSHQWPIALLIILLGALLGLVISYLLPSGYRAETHLAVSYNGDAIFRNPDDFKNWEMDQLELLAVSENVLNETLTTLQAKDSFWQEYTSHNLTKMVKVYWRNVGTWRLVVKTSRPKQAVQLAETWRQVILDTVQKALIYGEELTRLNFQIQTTAQAQVATQMRQVELKQIQNAIESWQKEQSSTNSNQSIGETQRWSFYSMAARAVQLNPAGAGLLNTIPGIKAPASEYQPWLEQLLVVVSNQQRVSEEQLTTLAKNWQSYSDQWNQTYLSSLGLSSYIMVKPIQEEDITAQRIKNYPIYMLVGGILGLLGWLITWLAVPYLRGKK
jgi:hypothetical protein